MTGSLRGMLNSKTICLFLLAAWCYAFWQTISSACTIYLHSGYDYQGFLVGPAIAVLVMHNSKSLKRANGNYSPFGLVLLMLCAFIWLMAKVLELELMKQFAIISMLVAIVWINFGRKITTILFLPCTCLFLLLPVGQPLYNYMQHGFTSILMQALTFCKQAVYWEGQSIVANNNTFDISAYLDSMHHILLIACLGAVYATFRTRNIFAAFLIQVSFVFMPFCILFISLFSYIFINKFLPDNAMLCTHMKACGWILTIVGIMHALVLGFFIRDRKDIINRNDNIDWRDMRYARTRFIQPLLLGACIMLTVPLIAEHIINAETYNTATLLSIPKSITGWSGQTLASKQKINTAKYKKSKDTVILSISHEEASDHKPWQSIKASNKTVEIGKKTIPVNETILKNAKNKYKVLWEVNYVNGHYTNNPTYAKALLHMYNLGSNGAKSGTIRITTDADNELNFARDRLKDFMHDFTESAIG